MNTKYKLSILLSIILCIAMLAACTSSKMSDSSSEALANTTGSTAGKSSAVTSISEKVKFESEDYTINWNTQSHQTIDLSKNTPTISKSGIYEITGTLKDGSLVVDVNNEVDKGIVYLVLNNADITSTTSAPIYIKDAEKVVLILESGTINTVYQGSGCIVDENEEPSAAVFSKSDLSITGSGTLNVASDYNDGITSKDQLKITDGTIVLDTKADGIVGKDVLAVEKCNMTITAGKDGMRSTNDTDAGMGNIFIAGGTFTVTSANDAIQAYGTLQIDGGTFQLISGGGYSENTSANTSNDFRINGGNRPQETVVKTDTESKKGLKATGGILINNGNLNISSYDDSVHSTGDITITNGTITLQSGDDGIHSDGNLALNGGTIAIKNSYEGAEGKNITISNGKIDLVSSDDGFNVNDSSGLLTINGGEASINAGGDGTDSNGSIKMTGGTVYVNGPTSDGNGAIDYNGSFNITGGTIIAAGSSGMAQCPGADSTQPSLLMYYSTPQAAGTVISVKDSTENTIAAFSPSKQYASAAISSPNMKIGQSYSLYSGSTKIVTFTLSQAVTYLNESGVTTSQSIGPGGGMQGGGIPNGGMRK